MADNEVLRTEENGIEFFTIVATGESAVSERGLAKMCGVRLNAVQYILNSLDQQNAPRTLENLVGQELYLTNRIVKKGKEIKVIKATVAIEIIQHYAFSGRETAQITLKACGAIGLTSYIQSKTGWLPEQYTALPEQHRILDEHAAWEKLYDPEMCRQAFAWFGGSFYWDFCYYWMTPEERCKVDRLNPVINGKRARKIHQYLDEDVRKRLTPKIETLGALLKSSDDRQDFLSRYRRAYGSGKQLELFK